MRENYETSDNPRHVLSMMTNPYVPCSMLALASICFPIRTPQLTTFSCGPPIAGQLMPSSWPPLKNCLIQRRRRQPQLMTSSCGPPIAGQLMPSSWPPLKNRLIQRRRRQPQLMTSSCGPPIAGQLMPSSWPPQKTILIQRRRRQTTADDLQLW